MNEVELPDQENPCVTRLQADDLLKLRERLVFHQCTGTALLRASVYLTPLGDRYFFHDGEPADRTVPHVFAVRQEQPYLIRVCQAALHHDRGNLAILDLCCGSGVIGQSLQMADGQLEGIDINPRAIAYARVNAELNGLAFSTFRVADVATVVFPAEPFDLIVSNPPYNALLDPTHRDITVHAGLYGDELMQTICRRAATWLRPRGVLAVMGTWLLSDDRFLDSYVNELAEQGTLVFVHGPLVKADTWEGLRTIFAAGKDFVGIPSGQLSALVQRRSGLTHVTFGVMLWRKDGPSGFHRVYNVPTDALLLSPESAERIEQYSSLGRN